MGTFNSSRDKLIDQLLTIYEQLNEARQQAERSPAPEQIPASPTPICEEAGQPPQTAPWPDRLEFSPILAMRAVIAGHGREWLLWAMARELDPSGSGVIHRDRLCAFALSQGFPDSSFRRWLSGARRLGLFKELVWRSGRVLIITGEKRAAEIMAVGRSGIGNKKASLPLKNLAGSDWKAWVWASFIATLKERPMSRRRMRDLTGVPERSQREYERLAGVTVTVNFAHDGRDTSHIAGIQEYERSHAFVWHNRRLGKAQIVWRLPDTRRAPVGVYPTRGGRLRKINRALKSGSSPVGRAHDERTRRIFFNRIETAESALRKYLRSEVPPWDDNALLEAYYMQPGGSGCQEWGALRAV